MLRSAIRQNVKGQRGWRADPMYVGLTVSISDCANADRTETAVPTYKFSVESVLKPLYAPLNVVLLLATRCIECRLSICLLVITVIAVQRVLL